MDNNTTEKPENPNAGNEKIEETTEVSQTGNQQTENKANYALIISAIAILVCLFGGKK